MCSQREMYSWKSDIFCAIVKKDIDKLEALLRHRTRQTDNISIYYAADCETCVINLEYPVDPSKHDVDNVLSELRPMIDSGRCRCLMSDDDVPSSVGQSVSLLHLVCLYGPVELIDELLDRGFDPEERTRATDNTPLHCLARTEQLLGDDAVSAAARLLELGADIDATDRRGNSVLHMAIASDNDELAVWLIDNGCRVDVRNDRGETPLLASVRRSKERVLVRLCQLGADPNIKDNDMTLALNVAIYKYSRTMVEAILSNPLVNVNATGIGKDGYIATPPLVLAASCGYDEAVEMLLDSGAIADCVDKYDNSPLIIAACVNNLDTARLLLRHGADVELGHPDGYGPLHFAAWEGHTEMCRLLLRAGAAIDRPTVDGSTALALACHDDHIDTIEVLLAGGCRVNIPSADRQAPIHYSAYNGNTDAVMRLLRRGADPDAENSLGVTPIWNAVYAGVPELVRLLIGQNVRLEVPSRGVDHGADRPVFIYDQPRTPLFVACAKNAALAQTLVLAGVRLDREAWLWANDLPEGLRSDRQLFDWIREQATRPETLLRITRRVIRQCLGVNPQNKVKALHLPRELNDFILIKSFVHDL